jgi:hypothetical protein
MTVPVIVAVVAGALSGLVTFRWLARRPSARHDGVVEFQRHLDALSPDARREVIGRVRGPHDAGNGG